MTLSLMVVVKFGKQMKMSEQELHDYNEWLTEVWNPNQLHIPFMQDAPGAYLRYKEKESKCSCDNGIIDCPGCKDVERLKDKINCSGCKGSGKVTCGKCGGK